MRVKGEIMSINNVVIEGRVGSDPSHHIFGNGGQVCSFSFAHNQYWTDKNGETKSKAVWIRVKAFDKLAEVFRDKCPKGQRIILTGSLDLNSWNDKETGKSNGQVELLAKNVRFLNSMSSSNTEEGGDDPMTEPTNLKDNKSLAEQGYQKFDVSHIPF